MVLNTLRISLQGKILVVLLLIVTISIGIFIGYFQQYKSKFTQEHINADITDTLHHASQKIADTIDAKLASYTSTSVVLSISGRDTNKLQELLKNLITSDPDVLLASVTDASGKELVKLDRNRIYTDTSLLSLSSTEAYQKTILNQQGIYLGPVNVTDVRVPFITIALPIQPTDISDPEQPSQNETLLGMLLIRVSIVSMVSDMQEYSFGNKGYIILADANGIVFAHPRPEFISTSVAAYPRSELAYALSQQKTPRAEFPTSTNFMNQEVMSDHTFIAKLHWVVIAEHPLSDLAMYKSGIDPLPIHLFTIPFIVAMIGGLYLFKTLVSPLRSLKTAAVEFDRGNYQYPLHISGRDEIGELSAAYLTLSSHLQQEKKQFIGQRKMLETVLDSLPQGVFGLDLHGKIVFVNEPVEKVLHTSKDELRGKSFDSTVRLFQGDKRIFFAELLQPDFKASTLRLIGTSGESKQLTLSTILLQSSDTSEIHYIFTVTILNNQQDLDPVKLDFVSMAAHELRTPLTAIRGYAQLIESSLSTSPDTETVDYVKRLTVSSENLSNLVDNLLNVTRIERNTLKLERIPLDISEIIKNVTRDMKLQAAMKQQMLEIILPSVPLPFVFADKFRIMQVVTNLIANAITYTPPGGRISISAVLAGSFMEISVMDSGVGIPKEALAKLFTKFYRVSGALEQGSKGTGLGLYICKTIVKMHGGEITVDSERNHGSNFRFTLPLATETEIQAHASMLKNPLPTVQHKGLVFNPDRLQKHITT